MASGTVVVCDALRTVAEALANHLAATAEFSVVGIATTAEALLDAAGAQQPSLVLLDATVPYQPGASLAAALRSRAPASRLLMTGPVRTPGEVAAALRDGAMGWLTAQSPAAEMVSAARAVLRGEYGISEAILMDVLQSLVQITDQPPTSPVAERIRAHDRLAALGERELDVLACLVGGLDRRAIANRLGIAQNTVRTHVGRILSKTGAHSMLEAAAIARQAGMSGIDI